VRALQELRSKGYDAHAFRCDVTEPADARRFINGVIDRWRAIDVLINNAGIIQTGPQQNMLMSDYRDAMNTHFWAPLHLIDAVLPSMRRRGQGRIVNIASIGGELSVAHLLPYCASKFALVGLSQGLSAELASQGIYVTTVCPGLMRTGSPRNALFKGQHRKEYAWFSIGASLPGLTVSSQKAARQIVRACRQGSPYLGISLATKVATRANAIFPSLFTRTMRVVNDLLPDPSPVGNRSYLGKESFSAWSPSTLTTLNERVAVANNEVR
jgi:NAD(P)-dependent dehydrogenase (short-subunit alcohol dehydrogenase family)